MHAVVMVSVELSIVVDWRSTSWCIGPGGRGVTCNLLVHLQTAGGIQVGGHRQHGLHVRRVRHDALQPRGAGGVTVRPPNTPRWDTTAGGAIALLACVLQQQSCDALFTDDAWRDPYRSHCFVPLSASVLDKVAQPARSRGLGGEGSRTAATPAL